MSVKGTDVKLNNKMKVKQIINVVLSSIALAMGIAVIVLTIIGKNIATNDLIKMLGIAIAALGLFALNKADEEKNDK
jgi:vacuolar-type H+-ATPase subunit I/STV1